MNTNKQKTFMQAYSSCHEAFVRYCSALAYGKMDSADLVQDVLLSAFNNFDGIIDKNKFQHYLFRSAKNRAISVWRKQKYQTELLEKHERNLMDKGVTADVLLDVQFLYKELAKLPSAQADALILYEISGFKMKEIAEILSKSESAVKTMISRGRTKLKAVLSQDESATAAVNVFKSLQSIIL